MALSFAQAVEEEKKKNILKGLSPEGFNISKTPISTITGATNLQNIQKPITQTGFSNESKTLSLPIINEIPSAQRDTELGKMNVATNGNKTTYAIGGNTLSYELSDKDKQLKTNLEKINQMVASGVAVSPEDMIRINNLRQQAGYLRGGTDRTLVNQADIPLQVGNMDVTFAPETDQAARTKFLENPVRPTAQIDRFNAQQNQSSNQGQLASMNADRILGSSKNTNDEVKLYTKENSPGMGWKTRKDLNQQILSNLQSNKNTLAEIGSQQNIALNKNAIDEESNRETNRINEMNTQSANKLRDIQGQVAQQPPIKENDSYDTIDINDPLTGNKVGQQLYSKRTGQILGGQSSDTETSIINSNPVYKKAFDEATPEMKSAMLKKLRERLLSGQ